jgi:diguanylate cyclase (GGDEF)-like protein
VTSAQQAIERAARDGRIAAVIVTELDDFKMVNNTMGHTAGDELLVAVGQAAPAGPGRLGAQTARPMVARLGGDEFAIWVEGPAGGHRPRRAGGHEQRRPSRSCSPPGAVTVTTSVGVATAADDADARSCCARPTWRCTWPRTPGRAGRCGTRLVAQRRGGPAPTCGPTSRSGRGRVVRARLPADRGARDQARRSASRRWCAGATRSAGLLGPGEFIGLAEESGLIVPLGGWVLHHAIKEASQWQRWRPETYVSVNVSARQLRAPGFVDTVRTQLSASGLPPTA